ncbi:Asp/Glu/hydantoin racemase [Methylobacterium currus]|uniref:Asp/Glu/hydantoin racemase n=1 Tax=Methylobacterium currus TaxID=2051553 RepID=A0A2R4WHA6_9HYPH|nr:Asp/Glu/hydantoin racemase [Methylobacterium currus]AWB20905.1 Asp/Glu/hydantoin racemase [Methylobacterium currus]
MTDLMEEATLAADLGAALALGVILPSSNRVVERATEARLVGLPAAACYARVPYGAMLKGESYDESVFLAAADLLAEAGVAALCWNATRGAALGFAPDEHLCAAVTRRTGLPMVTTALAARERIRRAGHRRLGLVVQGGPDEADLVRARFARAGIAIGSAAALGITENRLAAAVTPSRLALAAREAATGAGAVLIWSTNLPGWRLPPALDGVPLLDATTIGTEALLDAAGLPGA